MTSVENIKDTLRAIKPTLEQRFYVDSIGLFGSVLRKDFSRDSDIDIIVDFNRPIGIDFIDLAEFLESTLKRPVDLVSRKGVKPNYFAEIESEIIYV